MQTVIPTFSRSNFSAFKPCSETNSEPKMDFSFFEKLAILANESPLVDTFDKIEEEVHEKDEQGLLPVAKMIEEKQDLSQTDSSDHQDNTHSNASISRKLDAPKKRKNKSQTKLEIQEKQKDEGRGGNCIASNITKTLIRVAQNRLQTTPSQKFQASIQRYRIKSQKENTIIILLILFDLVSTGLLHFSIFENIFSFFMKSLQESKENCEKKMAEEPQRRGFHLKNRKMYVNFININREIYSRLVSALKKEESAPMDLKIISDIISDTYDRKQREIQKALNKIKSIILNHDSLKALFGYDQNDTEETLFEAIDYAYRRNLEKRCNQTKKKVTKFFEVVKQNDTVISEEEKFFMCYTALKLVGEKEEQIWEEFVKSTNLKRQYNQTEEEAQKLALFLTNEIPQNFSRFEMENSKGFERIYRSYIESKDSMEF